MSKIRGLKNILENNLRNADYQQNGQVAKDDFVNILFEATKEYLQASQAMAIVSQYAGSGQSVNYGAFISALSKGSQDDASPHVVNAMRD